MVQEALFTQIREGRNQYICFYNVKNVFDSIKLPIESFQCEIGRRILHLPKHYSGNAVLIGLHWLSLSVRIFLRKFFFFWENYSTLPKDTLCSRVYTSLANVVAMYRYRIGKLWHCSMEAIQIKGKTVALNAIQYTKCKSQCSICPCK